MYLKRKRCVRCVALRISELESTDNLTSQYTIVFSNGAFDRFRKRVSSVGYSLESTVYLSKML